MLHRLVHLDDDLLVVSKAKGVLTTPAHGEEGLVDVLDRQYVGKRRLAVVHRLDKDTSGLIVFARTTEAARHLSAQFARHSAGRVYETTVQGLVASDSGMLSAPLDGQKALTHFEVVRRDVTTTTLTLTLETGRRNQIRRHLADIGHPILGDVRFGGPARSAPGIALHAKSLRFVHPRTGETVTFSCPGGPEHGP